MVRWESGLWKVVLPWTTWWYRKRGHKGKRKVLWTQTKSVPDTTIKATCQLWISAVSPRFLKETFCSLSPKGLLKLRHSCVTMVENRFKILLRFLTSQNPQERWPGPLKKSKLLLHERVVKKKPGIRTLVSLEKETIAKKTYITGCRKPCCTSFWPKTSGGFLLASLVFKPSKIVAHVKLQFLAAKSLRSELRPSPFLGVLGLGAWYGCPLLKKGAVTPLWLVIFQWVG